jgi:hypothetical protein
MEDCLSGSKLRRALVQERRFLMTLREVKSGADGVRVIASDDVPSCPCMKTPDHKRLASTGSQTANARLKAD